MDEARVYLQARDKGKPPLVKPRMGYDELRCLEDEVVKEEDIEVQGPGPEGDIPLPCPLPLDGKEKGEEIPGLACPLHLQGTVEKVVLKHGRNRGRSKKR